jgi:hypothetical protein
MRPETATSANWDTEKRMSASQAVNAQTMLVRSPQLVHSAVDGEISMMHVETGKYYGLASVGAKIWGLLAEPMTVQAICDRLMNEYRIDRATCEADVLRFAERMAAEGVVTTVPASAAE